MRARLPHRPLLPLVALLLSCTSSLPDLSADVDDPRSTDSTTSDGSLDLGARDARSADPDAHDVRVPDVRAHDANAHDGNCRPPSAAPGYHRGGRSGHRQRRAAWFIAPGPGVGPPQATLRQLTHPTRTPRGRQLFIVTAPAPMLDQR